MKSFVIGCAGYTRHTMALLIGVVVGIFLFATSGNCQPPLPIEVGGKVLLPDGKPAAKATVEIAVPFDFSKITTTTQTDTDGHFSLTLEPGEYFLRAWLDTAVYETQEPLHINMNGGAPPQVFQLAKGGIISGKLIDKSTGKPVAGAQILMRDRAGVMTAEDGSFAFPVLPKQDYTLAVRKVGYSYSLITVNAGHDAVQLTMETKPEGIVKGRVTNTKGEPIAGAGVGPSGCYFSFQQTHTNANGEYLLSGYDPDQRIDEMQVFVDGYELTTKQGVIFPAGQHSITVDYQLKAKKQDTRVISGQVKAGDGTPVMGALVAFGFSIFLDDYRTTSTDQDGKYTLNGVAAREDMVVVQAEGYAPSVKNVAARGNARLDFTLQPGHHVEGRIIDETGAPLAGLHVWASMRPPEFAQIDLFPSRETYMLAMKATTDKDGHFRLDNLPAGKALISANGPGNIHIDELPLAVDRDVQRIEIPKRLQVTGTVVSTVDGKPIANFTIEDDLYYTPVSFASPDGTFTITNSVMKKGRRVRLAVEASGYCRLSQFVEPKSAHDSDPGQLVIHLKPAITFTGTISEQATGKGLDKVLVTLLDPGFWGYGGIADLDWSNIPAVCHPISAHTDTDGKFRIAAVPMRYGSVLLEKAGYGRTLLQGVNLNRPLWFSMEPGATISGSVFDEPGKPLVDTTIEIRSKDGSLAGKMKPDAGGKFLFADLGPGEYIIQQSSAGKVRKLHYAAVGAGEQYQVDWNRPGESLLEGTITRKGAPVAGANLALYPENQGWYDALGESGTDGTFRLNVPKAGVHMLMTSLGKWHASDSVEVNSRVVIEPGTNHLQIELPGAEVSGRMMDRKTGKPLAGVAIQLFTRKTELEFIGRERVPFSVSLTPQWFSVLGTTRTDGDGRFTLRNVGDGECLIALSNGTNDNIPSLPFTVGKNEKKECTVEIPLVGSAHISVVDAATGKPIPDEEAICVDAQGFCFYPERTQDMSGPTLHLTQDGKMIFADLPVGRYLAYSAGLSSQISQYPTTVTPFEVKADEVATVTLPMKRGGSLAFQLKENEDEQMPGAPWVGLKITSPDGKPVLDEFDGLHFSNLIYLGGETPRRGSLALRPGTYRIEAVLGYDRGYFPADHYLWRCTQTISIEEGKDTLIEIPWKADGKAAD